jgi:thiol-disulfide isomerase/thioredoxin
MEVLKKYGFWILLIGVGLYWAYRKWPHEIQIHEIQIVKNNQTVPLTIQGDSALIVHYFASWCGPCMKELPEWKNHLKELRAAGFQVVCITDDSPEIIQRIQDNIAIPIAQTESLNALHVFSIPMTYIYNAKGEQVQRMEGPLDWSNTELIQELSKLK